MSARIASIRLRLKKGVTFTWGERERAELVQLKQDLCTPGKALRKFDHTKPIVVHTDWSCYGISGVLSQIDEDGKEYLVACCSRSLNDAESRYAPFAGELLAVVYACRSFHWYIHGQQFKLYSDHHKTLEWLLTTREFKSTMHAKWALGLNEYDFSIVHKPGVENSVADTMSRLPVGGDRDFTGARLHDNDNANPARALALMAAHFAPEQVKQSL